MPEERPRRPSPVETPPTRFTSAILLSLALVLAATVRTWGIGFGLPNTACRPDEQVVVEVAEQFWSGDLNPRFFRYPTLHMYLSSLVYGGDYLLGRARGTYGSLQAFRERAWEDPAHFHLLTRGLTAFLGTATVLVVYALAASSHGRKAGLAAAFFLALTYLHARDSHFGTTDVAMTFFITLATLLVLRSYRDGRAQSYGLAGLMAGLACSTKYVGVLLAVPMTIAHLLRPRSPGVHPGTRLEMGKLVLFALGMGFGFLAGTPFALPEWRSVARDLRTEWQYLERGYGVVFAQGWWHHLRFSLFHGLGGSQLLAAFLGMGLWLVRRPGQAAVFLGFPLAYYFVIGRGQAVFVRYSIPLIPFLSVAAGLLVATASELPTRSWPARRAGLFLALLSVLTIAPSAARLFEFDRLLDQTDTRLLTRDWVEANIPPGEAIYQTGAPWGILQLAPSDALLAHRYPGPGNRPRRQALSRMREQRGSTGYDEWTRLGAQFRVNGTPTPDIPRFIIVQESPLLLYSPVAADIMDLLTARYQPRAFFVYNSPDPGDAYDQQDAFYLPFAGFRGVQRPGPNFRIYELRN